MQLRPAWIGGLVLAIGFAVPYAIEPVYDFAPPRPFRGAVLRNPYPDDSAPAMHWQKVNLHAHTRAWGGLTSGRGTPKQAVGAYATLGYDFAAITNYQRIDGGPGTRLGYEQGFNLSKSHILVLGATMVDWYDLPLFESQNTKQYRIERLSQPGVVTIIAHPSLRDGFSEADLRLVSGYTAIEVMNPYGNSDAQWDAALTAGRPVWATGGDDTHDANNIGGMGRAWTMVRAPTAKPQDILDAVAAGRTVAVSGTGGRADVWLDALTVLRDTIDLRLGGHPARITFVGQDGRVLATVPRANAARFVLAPGEPYARAVVETRSTRLVLNPVVRTEDGQLTVPRPKIDVAKTTTRRVAIGSIAIALFLDWLGVLSAIERFKRRQRYGVTA